MEHIIRFTGSPEEKSGIKVCFEEETYEAKTPVNIEIKETDGTFAVYSEGYEDIKISENRCLASATIKTKYNSVFHITDNYEWGDCEVIVKRKVRVLCADGHECGFSSFFGIGCSKERPLSGYDAFVPGIWYRKNENVVDRGFESNPYKQYHLMRITRMAMPYVELFNEETGSFIAMKHLSPVPDTGIKETSAEWLVEESFQYASRGFLSYPNAQLQYHFPGSEGEINYIEPNKQWARRSHPVREGFTHSYSFSMMGGRAKDTYGAMGTVWKYYCEQNPPAKLEVDYHKAYEDSIKLLDIYCQEYNGAMGIPFWANVPEGSVCDISYQMGFVGQQTMCAYHLLKYGYENRMERLIQKAGGIIDFWVKESIRTSVIPRVWYNVFPGTFKEEYPTYTRTVADGMEGILVCCELAMNYGKKQQEWYDFCLRYGDWLVENQNSDGSYFRSYNELGEAVHKGKFNTSNVIRYLVNLYWFTKQDKYKKAAWEAGNFCYKNIHEPMQYVGGTADNDNTIDKEAGMIAIYAFMSLYEMDGKKKWLKAAMDAADFCETWTYAWKYPVKPFKGNAIFDKVGFTGLSLIATGHSHADVMMGYMPYEYYRLYQITGDRHYFEFAQFIHSHTKQIMD